MLAPSGPIELFYEDTKSRQDTGAEQAPVLLVMGLGMAATGWWRTVPVLSERFRVLSFDNRGAGRSDKPPGPYTVAQLADDAVAVLDAAGLGRAHVYGVSLGGMIAQEIALRHPARVDRLILAATTAGGRAAVPASEDVQRLVAARATMSAEQAVWASVPINYAPRTRRDGGDRIAADIVQRLRYPIDGRCYGAQLAAAQGHDAADRLAALSARTLVVHGDEDVLIPPGNGHRLARLVPGAELHTWVEAAHLYFTDEPAADEAIRDWLATD